MGLRTKGIPGSGDTSGFANAARLEVEGAQAVGRGIEAIGQGVGQGILRIKAAREKAAADKESARRFDAGLSLRRDEMRAKEEECKAKEADALGLAKARQQFDDLESTARLYADEMEVERAQYQAHIVQGMGSPGALESPEWVGKLKAHEAKLQDLQGRIAGMQRSAQLVRENNPRITEAPRIVVPTKDGAVDITDPAYRSADAEAQLAAIDDTLNSKKLPAGERLRLMARQSVLKAEVAKAKEQATFQQKQQEQKAKDAAEQPQRDKMMEDFSVWSRALPGADAPGMNRVRAQLAVAIAAGRMNFVEASTRFAQALRPTEGYQVGAGAAKGAGQNAKDATRGLPIAGDVYANAQEAQQARLSQQRELSSKSEHHRRVADSIDTVSDALTSRYPGEAPKGLGLVSRQALEDALSYGGFGEEMRQAIQAELAKRGPAPGAAAPAAPAGGGAPVQRERWEVGPDGTPRRVK